MSFVKKRIEKCEKHIRVINNNKIVWTKKSL